MISRISIALGAGFLGGLANVLAIVILNSLQGGNVPDKTFIYKQVFWGGLWALLYGFNFLQNNWIYKGIVVSVLASLATFFVFKAIPFTPDYMLRAFIVNVIAWGGVSSFVYHKSVTN